MTDADIIKKHVDLPESCLPNKEKGNVCVSLITSRMHFY